MCLGTTLTYAASRRFFSSAILGHEDWKYRLGDFAEKTLPIVDSVDLTIQRAGTDVEENITVSVITQKGAQYLYTETYLWRSNIARSSTEKYSFLRGLATNTRSVDRRPTQTDRTGLRRSLEHYQDPFRRRRA